MTDLDPSGTLSFEPPSVDASHQLYVAFSNVADGQHWVGVDDVVFVEAPPVEDPGEGTSTGGAEGTGADATGPDTFDSEGSTGEPTPGTSSTSGGTDTDDPSASSGAGGCRTGGDAPWWLLALLPMANLRRRCGETLTRRSRSSR